MTPILSKPSSSAPTSLFYITLGALMTAWSAIWYFYLNRVDSDRQGLFYLCTGFLVTGLVLLTIGISIGPLARQARKAELPPTEAMGTVNHGQGEQQRTS
jgi:hypothetical protein